MNDVVNRILGSICLFAAMIPSAGIMAQTGSLTDEIQTRSLPVESQRLEEYVSNPAAMGLRDTIALSALSVSGDYLHQKEAVKEELGRGHTLFVLGAESYMPMGKSGTAWGKAGFVSGLYRDVRWTDCIDYERVAPYVLGDATGGNLNTRRYSFSGGYAHRAGDWTFGIEAGYRAEMAYRNRDPRVKTIASDLDMDFGAAFRLSGGRIIGLSAGLNIYNQNCDLDFYNPVNQIQTYTLTGLGTYYKRFSGNTNKNSGYESTGWRAAFQLLPTKSEGVSASVRYLHYRMEQRLRNFNNLTLGFTENDIVDFSVVYRRRLSPSLLFAPQIDVRIFMRDGSENIFGTSAGASYDKIGSPKPYAHRIYSVAFGIPLQFGRAGRFLTITPSATYVRNRESCNDPVRLLSVTCLTPRINIEGSVSWRRKWLIEANIGVARRNMLSHQSDFGDLDMATALGQCVADNYGMLRADCMVCDAGVKVSREICGVLYGLSLGCEMADYKDKGISRGAVLTLSATF